MGSMFRVLSRAVWSPCQYSTHVCMGSGFSSLSLGIEEPPVFSKKHLLGGFLLWQYGFLVSLHVA